MLPCTGTPVHTATATVDKGNDSYTVSWIPTSPGTYYWLASYTGDTNNEPASHSCNVTGEVDTVNQAQPGLVTTPRLLPNDSATLSGGYGTLGGTITFKLFNNADCSGSEIYMQTVDVTGAGTYATTNTTVFITPGGTYSEGTYSWLVVYAGDANNNQALSSCTAE